MDTTSRDMRIIDASLYFLPVEMRVPLKFGSQVLTKVICARACVKVEGADGSIATGWGETPLSVGWVWPAAIDYDERANALEAFTSQLTRALKTFETKGHALEIGHAFIETQLNELQNAFNAERSGDHALPHLAALVCFSPRLESVDWDLKHFTFNRLVGTAHPYANPAKKKAKRKKM